MKALRSCAAMVVAIACCAPAAGARVEDVTSLVNPFVGTTVAAGALAAAICACTAAIFFAKSSSR